MRGRAGPGPEPGNRRRDGGVFEGSGACGGFPAKREAVASGGCGLIGTANGKYGAAGERVNRGQRIRVREGVFGVGMIPTSPRLQIESATSDRSKNCAKSSIVAKHSAI